MQVRCRYLLRVTVTGKGMTPDTKKEFNFWVTNYEAPSEVGQPIKVGCQASSIQLDVHNTPPSVFVVLHQGREPPCLVAGC